MRPARDATLSYRRDSLATDAAAIRTIADRLQMIILDLHHDAAEASDHATAQAMLDLASALADTLHDNWQSVTEAHAAATDELGIEPLYADDAATCVAFRLPAYPELADVT